METTREGRVLVAHELFNDTHYDGFAALIARALEIDLTLYLIFRGVLDAQIAFSAIVAPYLREDILTFPFVTVVEVSTLFLYYH